MGRIIILILSVVFFIQSQVIAQNRKGLPPEKPKLIVAIVVDMMRYDYLYRYWDKFENGGFKRLVKEGTLCRNTNLNYLFTQTAVGHASIFTGATPSVHGIVSNYWYDNVKEKKVYCTEDSKVKAVGGKNDDKKMSPKKLMSSTIGDQIKLATNSRSKVIGVSIKERSAILSAGHMADAAYWYDDNSGKWMTSSYYMDTLPKWVKKFNKHDLADVYLEKMWEPLLAIEEYTASLPDENIYETGINRAQHIFPYNLLELSEGREKQKDYSLLKYTPYGNTYTLDFSLAALDNEGLGKDDDTDLLIISFSPTDYLGHYYGPRAVEVQDMYLRLDQQIAHLLNFIDNNIGKENTLVILTSDHGVADSPKFLKDNKSPGGTFNQNYALALLKSYLNALYGEGEWVRFYSEQQVYLNHELIDDAKIPLSEIQEKCAEFLIQFSGISHALPATTLQKNNFTEGIFRMIQNTYYRQRCGDIIISLAPGYIEDIAYSTTHNSAYSYDTHIPLIWFGWKVGRSVVDSPVDVTDIAPTISNMLNISFPNGSFGSPILNITQ